MRIIDTFLFSEPHEKELLLTKFHLEDLGVDKWVILESPYTFQGEYKGLHVSKILNEDIRFQPFVDKIIVINPAKDFTPLHGNTNDEGKNFDRENAQRAMVLGLIHELADNDWVMISDTDEAVDFSDITRKNNVLYYLNGQSFCDMFKLQRQRYWFDFDNKCFLPNIHIPLVKAGLIKQNSQCIMARHFDHIPKVNFDDKPVAFEYSYCFPSFEDVWRKKCTYSHTGFTQESVRTALECNHWPRSELRGEKVGQEPYDFFEKVELTEENSPKYVRENLEKLRTNIVNPNYKEARVARYGV